MARPLIKRAEVNAIAVATAALDLPFPPTAAGFVPASWGVGNLGLVPEFDLEIWANASTNLTGAELLGGVLRDLVVADDTFVGEADDDTLTAVAHGLLTGDGPVRVSNSGGALPGGLAAATDYYVIRVDDDMIKLATSRANAVNRVAIALSTDGTGTQTLSDTADTTRITWQSHGLLGNEADGAVVLTSQRGYTTRCRHRSAVVAYAVTASLSASDPEAVSVRGVPVIEVP